MNPLLKDDSELTQHVVRTLCGDNQETFRLQGCGRDGIIDSAVLFPLGRRFDRKRSRWEPCVILNKRSRMVRQPGDLCCPGGSISPRMDGVLARVLALPRFPLTRWPCWKEWRTARPEEARNLALLYATSLRESFEEMKLNPFGVRFLGPLPAQELLMFHRVIHPMVGWVARQKRFFPNWEVDRVVRIPLRDLLKPERYGRYRLHAVPGLETKLNSTTQDFPCFIHRHEDGDEVLWGATFRMVVVFLDLIFGFQPPDTSSVPAIPGILDETYMQGAR